MDDGFKKPDDVLAKEEEAEDVEKATNGQNVDNKKDELTRVETMDPTPELPFSKARTVAMVATVAGAPFLSVGLSSLCSRLD